MIDTNQILESACVISVAKQQNIEIILSISFLQWKNKYNWSILTTVMRI